MERIRRVRARSARTSPHYSRVLVLVCGGCLLFAIILSFPYVGPGPRSPAPTPIDIWIEGADRLGVKGVEVSVGSVGAGNLTLSSRNITVALTTSRALGEFRVVVPSAYGAECVPDECSSTEITKNEFAKISGAYAPFLKDQTYQLRTYSSAQAARVRSGSRELVFGGLLVFPTTKARGDRLYLSFPTVEVVTSCGSAAESIQANYEVRDRLPESASLTDFDFDFDLDMGASKLEKSVEIENKELVITQKGAFAKSPQLQFPDDCLIGNFNPADVELRLASGAPKRDFSFLAAGALLGIAGGALIEAAATRFAGDARDEVAVSLVAPSSLRVARLKRAMRRKRRGGEQSR